MAALSIEARSCYGFRWPGGLIREIPAKRHPPGDLGFIWRAQTCILAVRNASGMTRQGSSCRGLLYFDSSPIQTFDGLWGPTMPEIVNMFPLSIYTDKVEIDSDYKNHLVKQILEMGKRNFNKRPGKAWTGDRNAFEFLHNEELFQRLFHSFSKPMFGYLEHLRVNPRKIDFYYTRSWATISGEHENILDHTHTQSHISLVYYLTKPKNSGGISFSDRDPPNEFVPNLFSAQMISHGIVKDQNVFNGRTVVLKPEEGQIVIFPSKITHATPDSQTSDVRISIAADIVVTLKEQTNVEFLMPNTENWKKFTFSPH